jgi:hypothetical protein
VGNPSVVWDESVSKKVDAQLARLETVARAGVLRRVVRKAGEVVRSAWQAKIPVGKRGAPHLRDSLATKVIDYPDSGVLVAIVGGDVAQGARYLHLVEEGHELWFMGSQTGRRTKAGKYRDDAIAETENEVETILVQETTRIVDSIMGAG